MMPSHLSAWCLRAHLRSRAASGFLLAGAVLALAGCAAVPTGPAQQPGIDAPAPAGQQSTGQQATGRQATGQEPIDQRGPSAGQATQEGTATQGAPAATPAQTAPPGQPAPPAAEPERTIALLATRQLRCADAGPQGQDPQQAIGEAFLDETQWRAHLTGIDEGIRTALASLKIDFKAGESAALVRPGALPNLGYRISIPQASLPVTGQVLTVRLVVEPPPSHLLQAQVIAFPCIYLRLGGGGYGQVVVEVERLPAP